MLYHMMIQTWMLVSLIPNMPNGAPLPLAGHPIFNTLSGCEIYKHVKIGDDRAAAWNVQCSRGADRMQPPFRVQAILASAAGPVNGPVK